MPAGLIKKKFPPSRAGFGLIKVRSLVQSLRHWFRQNARDLPWRRTRDPYAIWISEVMLQQTQVKTVIPYWNHWMRDLPTVRALARAPLDNILKHWEGLGYYTRARHLHLAAKRIVNQHGGRFPEVFGEVISLPGVGRYTAGAICSIAYDQPAPILDGNVIRVFTRLLGIDADPANSATRKLLWTSAEALVTEADRIRVDGERPCADVNQALMELGALVCTPSQPRCFECPVRRQCVALRESRVAELPNLGQRPRSEQLRFIAFVIERERRFLVRRRPRGVLNADLWEFPNVELAIKERADIALERLVPGLRLAHAEPALRLRHSITRYRITVEVYGVTVGKGAIKGLGPVSWQSKANLSRLAFTAAHRRIADWLGQARKNTVLPILKT